MLRRWLLTGLAVVVLAGVIGCSKEETTEPEPVVTGEIMPLAVGNLWRYEVHIFPDTGSPYFLPDSIYINTIDTLDNVVCFEANGADHFLKQKNGLWYLPSSGTIWSLLLKYPAAVNDLWTSGSSGEYVVGLLSKSARVLTSVGEFTCYKYVREYRFGGEGATYYYVVPDTGIVQYEQLDETNSRVARLGQLVELSLVD